VESEIAVVGIGCNFPGGEGPENFWRVLLHGENCAVQIPNDRFNLSQWYDPNESKAGKTYTAKAALINGLNEFDNKFFGITDAETNNMDPQHKLLLQCTYRALEDAGIPMEKASGTRTGVFLGLMNRDFELARIRISPKHIDHTIGTGVAMSIAANRISYIFNFTGPSLSIDCACSSSLVALHLACQAIKQGDCEMAVCGGVSCILEPVIFVSLSKAKMISSDGTSKPFSSKADGYGRGEGCGIILLKPLKKALEDHDHIWGIICKTAVNQDGHSVSPITKPSMVQQEELLKKIYSTETDLTSVQYIEAHGTGTPVGDPVEAGSISKVIAKARPKKSGPLIIGSVKSNIGHTESAAGVAGLIKVLLMMEHKTIVPSLFYSMENSSIDIESLNMKIPTTHYRSSLQSTVTGGKMLVVSNMAVSEVLKILPSYSGRVCLAAYNSPQSCTLSGDADDIDRLHQILSISARGTELFLRILDVPAAYHSHKMDPIVSKVKESIGSLQAHNLETELFSTVTGVSLCSSDFITGEYWAKNIREPVKFEQAVKSAAENKSNVIFVEIGPRRSLQRYITETLGKDFTLIPSVLPDKDHETMLAVVSKLFEIGVKVDWEMFYKGFETEPIPYPRYQFDGVKKDVVALPLQSISPTGNHPVVTQMGTDSSMFSCDLSSESVSFLQDHKHSGVTIIPGAFYAELGLATYMAYAKPKVPLSSLQLSITFQSPFIFTQNSPDINIQLDHLGNLADNTCNFKVQSTSAVYAFGTVEAKPGRIPEEQFISLDCISKRCTFHMTTEELYTHLNNIGFEYGSVFRNKADVYCGEEFGEAISIVKVQEELLPQLHDYHLHPVVLDYVMQLVPAAILDDQSTRPLYPAQIGSLTVFEPLQEEMVAYLRAIHVGEDDFDICGCLANKQGRVLVELRHVKIRMLGSRSQVVKEYFFHNDFSINSEVATFDTQIKALVFSDQVGISKALQQYLDPTSRYVSSSNGNILLEDGVELLLSNLSISSVKKCFQDILFMWGDADLTSLDSDNVLDIMASFCEIFQKLVRYLKTLNFPGDIRVVTYRLSGSKVDHINPGFVLSGMIRACAAELPELNFQLIDMSSATTEDIKALVQVLRSYPCSKYPELVVKEGKILKPEITHTSLPTMAISSRNLHMLDEEDFILQTSDPYIMTNVSATQMDNSIKLIQGKNIELLLSKICVHSSDYFPVSISDLNYGKTLYWIKLTNENHKLLALDFSGTVTAVGKDVSKFKVGDHVVSCYPVAATSKVVLPAAVCCKAKRLSFLNEIPCVSYMVLAWKIFHEALPKSKQKRKLGIFSTVPDSALMTVLIAIANRSGWNVRVSMQADQLSGDFSEVVGAVLLPPYNVKTAEIASSVTGIKYIVFVCDNQTDFPLNSTTFRGTNEEVYYHVLCMSKIMQKSSLQTQMPQIYRWLISMDLGRKVKSQDIDLLSVKESESYFRCQIVPIIVLNSEAKDQLSDIPVMPKHCLFQKDSVYIVTGGLTGLGFETVKFIAQKGGGKIVILSRSNPNSRMQQEISQVSSQWDSVIKSLPCDVSISEQVDQMIVNIGKLFPSSPIKGVFHSAVVLHDGLIERLDRSLYEKVMRPKVNGVINLHRATLQCNLDYFVCYSSISAFIGNPAQTNYAAANTFMDTFCQYRRNIGLSGQSINWGALNLGLLLNKVQIQRFLEAKGIMLLEIPEIHESLEQCLLINKPQQVVCRFDFKKSWNNILSQNKSLSVRLYKIAQEAIIKTGVIMSRPEQPMTSSSPRDYLQLMISETAGVEMDELNDDVKLFDLGIDSMLAMTLQNILFTDRGVNVPLVTLLDPNSTLLTLIKILEQNCVEEYQNDDESNSTYL
uniref:Si:dkey-61p9.11 n=1 Tax=Cyprinus carpio TaxID=7962 RepID=A0A8C2DIH2_CYPCA